MQTYARYCFPLLILSGLFLAFTARGNVALSFMLVEASRCEITPGFHSSG
jgi:hypothetical protein